MKTTKEHLEQVRSLKLAIDLGKRVGVIETLMAVKKSTEGDFGPLDKLMKEYKL
jgi:hypothetical protein